MKLKPFLKARKENLRLKCEICNKELFAKDLNYTNEKVLCDKDSDKAWKKRDIKMKLVNVCCPIVSKRFKLFPYLLNSITWKKGEPKIFRWLFWNWSFIKGDIK